MLPAPVDEKGASPHDRASELVVVKPAVPPPGQDRPVAVPPQATSATSLGLLGSAAAPPLGSALAAGHFYLQPIEPPPGLTLPEGLPSGGMLVYLVPLPVEAVPTPSLFTSKALQSVPEHAESRAARPSSMDHSSPPAKRETYSQAGRPQCAVDVAPDSPERAAAAYVEDDVLEQSLESSMDLRM